ncbi:hypothetical protein KP509_37G012700 [Ceratopteris richardii]|uniref:Uncharacterized protein n=1 Tax=Ceratopteris richardii TaxID=49495 RepID=A0A8T2Q6I0_CERRI|nr:hypothetical protein KP509_37G012700 [Ceratopteris richardii]
MGGEQQYALKSGAGGCDGEPPSPRDSLVEAAIKVLSTGDPWLKAEYGDIAARLWKDGLISRPFPSDSNPRPPSRPARSTLIQLVTPQNMPKLGKGGSLQSRQALLHSLVHIESWAIDLSWFYFIVIILFFHTRTYQSTLV